MSDVMKIAKSRQEDLKKAITAKETEIAELREEIESLTDFLEFGQSLAERAAGVTKVTPKAAQPAPTQPAQTPEAKDITDLDFDPFEDGDDAKGSVSQLRPQSRPQPGPQSRPA